MHSLQNSCFYINDVVVFAQFTEHYQSKAKPMNINHRLNQTHRLKSNLMHETTKEPAKPGRSCVERIVLSHRYCEGNLCHVRNKIFIDGKIAFLWYYVFV